MKNILIIYPHWPPSNLAGVHRPRLVANYLEEFGWKPTILTVHPAYYEEEPDWDLLKTVKESVKVEHVAARPVSSGLRLIGDIGLRAWSNIKKRALEIIKEREIGFIWIPIPSFYMAIMGRVLHDKTGVPYGIDYIDPWVRDISNRKDLRSVISLKLAEWMEPYAVRKAALISGVSEAYYRPVFERNPSFKEIEHLAFPYGFDPEDHNILLENLSNPWSEEGAVTLPLVYAGAFLPNSRMFIQALFKAVGDLDKEGKWPEGAKLYFLGTGNYPGKSILYYAKEAGISHLVTENRKRFPFLHILNYLSAAYAVMVIGSTEKHYTASKTFQSILSQRPVFAMLHGESSAVEILENTEAAAFTVKYREDMSKNELVKETSQNIQTLFQKEVSWHPKIQALAPFSSRENAKLLAAKLDELV